MSLGLGVLLGIALLAALAEGRPWSLLSTDQTKRSEGGMSQLLAGAEHPRHCV
jgi:hypothetical protein